MVILGIETSCDETACAVLKKEDDRIQILSNVVASSAALQTKYGGIIPEQAAREQIKSIIPVIETAINDSRLTINDINAVAVTYGPGLIGSLLVGVETAKTLALIWNKPLIPVNHLIGHFYANWITSQLSVLSGQLSDTSQSVISKSVSDKPKTEKLDSENRKQKTDNLIPTFPCIGLLVSGGHTDLVLFTDHGQYKYLGGTRDDAAGECFDKCARLLGLPYPGGPEIAKLARKGNPKAFDLPRPMIDSDDFDFSFSGLKTSVSNILPKRLTMNDKQSLRPNGLKRNLAASIEQAIVDVLVDKTIKAAKMYKVKNIMIAGGVASNKKLREQFLKTINESRLTINLAVPPPNLCTDNAAMIASAAFFLPRGKAGQQPITNPLKLQADPNLALNL